MNIYIDHPNLSKTQRYPASKRHIKNIFSDFNELTVLFRKRKLEYPHSSYIGYKAKPPSLKGPIVAYAYLNKDFEPRVCILSLKCDEYPNDAAGEFTEIWLPHIDEWLKQRLAKSKTELIEAEEILIEWTGYEHKEHVLRLREYPWP